MKRLLTYLGLLTALLAMPNISMADNWAYYLIGEINSWDTSGCQSSDYKFGDTSNSTDDITWYKDYTGAQLDPNADGTAYFKFYVNKNSQYYYYLYNNNGNNNTSVTIDGSTVDVVSNQGTGSFQVSGISQTTNYRIYLQTGTNSDREKGTVRIEAIGTNVYTSSVDLLGTINNWAEATDVLTKDGSEYKLELTKTEVDEALWQGDFYFRFIEHMSDNSKYTVVPNVIQTPLTVNGGYTSDTYATTNTGDNKKDYYWKFTPTGADNYTIYFKNDNGTRSVKVTDDRPIWYLHSNLGGANAWDGETDYALIYNAASGYYERSFTEAEINSGIDGQEMRFRIYDGTNSWGPQVSSYVFDDTGSESYTSTTNSTGNYFSIPKDFISAKIEAKQATGGGILVNVTLVYDVNYYWVSPQITNGEKWEYFKMVPSRNRNQTGGGTGDSDGKISKKYYTFTIKNKDLVTWKTKSEIADGTEIQWYIVREDDGLFFRPESDNPTATEEGTSISYGGVTDTAVGYRNFKNDYHTSDATRTGYFEFNKGYNDTNNTHSALAYTFMINDENGNVFFDYAHTAASTSIGYDLVGNFAGATSSENIDINDGRAMTKYWYKDGLASTTEVEAADSIVYKVEVKKPANGWGNLYIDVNPQGNEDWSKVLRPLISLGNNLDGRALHGALTIAKSEQSLNPEPSASYQSYTFSFNATTRTYNLEFHMPDATLSPGYENNEYVFDNSWGETIAVKYSDATPLVSAATKCYIVAGGSSAISLDGVTATDKADLSSFNLTYDGTYIKMNGTQVATGKTVYIKIQGEDADGNKGDVHLYQYTFNAKMSFEPRGGLFINSAKIKIEGGVAPYRYEIWHYNTKTENGETVIDYANNPKKLSEGTFSNTAYDADDNNHRISTPGFLKIIDAHGLEMSYDEVGGGFDFTYSTSENYKRNTTGAAITDDVDPNNAGAYPNGADYWLAAPGDLTRLLSPTWLDSSTDKTHESYIGGQKLWNGETGTCVYLGPGVKIYQTVSGLAAGTYTVQALVSGGVAPIHLELNNTEVGKVLLTGEGTETVASINIFGRCEHLENMKESTSDRAWHKLEGSATVSAGGDLKIAIRAEGGACLADVVLLKNANTTSGFRTTASTSPTDITCYDYRRQQVSGEQYKQNNAYSFFDRGKNQNAVIFANNKTVIAMDPANLADVPQNATLRAQDRRHPFNVVGSTEQDAAQGTAKALYLTDAGYDPNDANCLPVRMGTSGDANYNSTNYRTHGYSFCPGLAFYAEDLIFDRDMSQMAVKKTTCMLPVAFTPAQLKTYYGSDLKVYKWASRSGNDLTFAQQSDATELNANEPYIFWGAEGSLDTRGKTAGKTDGKFHIGAITSTNHNAASSHSGFPGTYAYMKVKRYGDASGAGTNNIDEAEETRFIYSAANGVFSVVSANGANLKPFRAYFVIGVTDKANEARQLNIFFDDSIITGIDSVETTAPTSGDIYTIGGVLVAKDGNMSGLPKGIYIMNGKKFVVK
ncbi:MAG: hypothetical protein SPK85_01045 [Prevotella sp.]|nr:hypothetical protein [Prevotella sp.]